MTIAIPRSWYLTSICVVVLYAPSRFAAWLDRSPETALPDCDINNSTRNIIMTGVKFLFRVTLHRHDLVAEIYHLREPQKIPPVMSQDEVARLLASTASIKAQAMLSLASGCGLRPGEVVRLRVGDIDSDRRIIRIVQSKGDKDCQVMLPAVLDLLRRHWCKRPTASMTCCSKCPPRR